MRHRYARFYAIAAALLVAAILPAEEPPSVPNFGTSNLTYVRVPGMEFFPANGGGYKSPDYVGRYPVSDADMYAPIHLPGGSLIQYLEINFCDSVDPQDILLDFLVCSDEGAGCNGVASVNSFAAPGCSSISTGTGPVITVIDNRQHTYILAAHFLSVNDPSLVLTGVVVGYQLQVSPPPATATFNDVPTGHPFFQFIEALAASGITSGCGGGNYCPDSPLTRGQMAVFLAKALGLQWSNY